MERKPEALLKIVIPRLVCRLGRMVGNAEMMFVDANIGGSTVWGSLEAREPQESI
jgi:hypothetical protein